MLQAMDLYQVAMKARASIDLVDRENPQTVTEAAQSAGFRSA